MCSHPTTLGYGHTSSRDLMKKFSTKRFFFFKTVYPRWAIIGELENILTFCFNGVDNTGS